MEEILNFSEFGALAVISGYLLVKGTSALKELAESNKNLADAVGRLSDKVSLFDLKIHFFSDELKNIRVELDAIKRTLANLDARS